MNLGNLSRLSSARTRSISPENFTGEKGKGGMATEGTGSRPARELGQGWKMSPSIVIEPGECRVIADIREPGAIQHIWMTPTKLWRWSIIRFYWDDQETPSVECPVGDFFACAWNKYSQISSLPVCVNPGSGLNCYWEMPFRKSCKITMTNIGPEAMCLYYQIDYTLTDVPEDAAYFHAQFRRSNPVGYGEVHTLLDGVHGIGHFVGTYAAWTANSSGWWGEGEIKFYMDGDTWPTICGTGTEDYFCGSYDFNPGALQAGASKEPGYAEFSTPYSGLAQVIRPDGLYSAMTRFGLYRWHIMDPVRFESDLKVTIQDIGWYKDGRYRPRQDDIASVAYWYQTLPTAAFPALPGRDQLESDSGI
ncbi:MAG: DUF2961 domain-containing protein [Armatimonadetes bacterium]|nr:DUF2961 domain-containing protein [Armatimonadota bacterium]